MTARPRPTDAQPAAGPRVIDHDDDPAALRAIEHARRAYAEASRIAAGCAAESARPQRATGSTTSEPVDGRPAKSIAD